jgi:hypothetical protein
MKQNYRRLRKTCCRQLLDLTSPRNRHLTIVRRHIAEDVDLQMHGKLVTKEIHNKKMVVFCRIYPVVVQHNKN